MGPGKPRLVAQAGPLASLLALPGLTPLVQLAFGQSIHSEFWEDWTRLWEEGRGGKGGHMIHELAGLSWAPPSILLHEVL